MNLKDFDKIVKEKRKELTSIETKIASLNAKKPTLQKEINDLTEQKINIKKYLEKKETDLMISVDNKAEEVAEELRVAKLDTAKAKQLKSDAQELYLKAKRETDTVLSGSATAESKKAEVDAKAGKIKNFAETVRKFADSL